MNRSDRPGHGRRGSGRWQRNGSGVWVYDAETREGGHDQPLSRLTNADDNGEQMAGLFRRLYEVFHEDGASRKGYGMPCLVVSVLRGMVGAGNCSPVGRPFGSRRVSGPRFQEDAGA